MQETQGIELRSWVGKVSRRRKWQPTPVFLPGTSHGQRSLAGYSPWGCEESDMHTHTQPKCTPSAHTHIPSTRSDWCSVSTCVVWLARTCMLPANRWPLPALLLAPPPATPLLLALATGMFPAVADISASTSFHLLPLSHSLKNHTIRSHLLGISLMVQWLRQSGLRLPVSWRESIGGAQDISCFKIWIKVNHVWLELNPRVGQKKSL